MTLSPPIASGALCRPIGLKGLSHWFPGQGEPCPFLLGQLRPRGDLCQLYSSAYPEPPGFRGRPVTPGAHFESGLGEFILPYDTVRNGAELDALLLDFLSTTYAAAAETGGWDRAALECPIGVSVRVRQVQVLCEGDRDRYMHQHDAAPEHGEFSGISYKYIL